MLVIIPSANLEANQNSWFLLKKGERPLFREKEGEEVSCPHSFLLLLSICSLTVAIILLW